jgi:type III restriction enzyme
VRGFEVNTLTVIATESYQQFADHLQKEIEADTGIRFGMVEAHQFAAIALKGADGQIAALGFEQSKVLWEHLHAAGYIDAQGKVQDALRQAIKTGNLLLPVDFAAERGQITAILRKLSGRLEVRDADKREQVRTRQAVLHSPEFKALWDRIKHQTTYRVQFDNAKLIEDCVCALRDAPPIARTRLQWRKADIAIGKAGVEAIERAGAATITLHEDDIALPDILSELQDRTQLTRKSVVQILTQSGRLDDFKRNPQQFIELASEIIKRSKRMALVDGIKYQRLGDEQFYAQELFEQQELTGYLKSMLMNASKSVYEHVIYDSGTERDFADALEKNEAIKVYAKLPGWFKVPTPLGSYNPDWAVLVATEEGAERLYFVVETKGSVFKDDLRDKEQGKIKCGQAHFRALAVDENPARFVQARELGDVFAEI